MKKLIILLLFPLVSFSQITYKDVMSINNEKMFKKLMIENYFEKDKSDNDWITYGYEIQKDSINGNKAKKWGYYNSDDDGFLLVFSIEGIFGLIDESDYDNIVKGIKKNCTYYDIITYTNEDDEEYDYVCYSCSERKYKGKIGFMIIEDAGLIKHFPNN